MHDRVDGSPSLTDRAAQVDIRELLEKARARRRMTLVEACNAQWLRHVVQQMRDEREGTS